MKMEFKEALQRARNMKVELGSKGVSADILQSKDIGARQQALQGIYKFDVVIKDWLMSRDVLSTCVTVIQKHGGQAEGTLIQQPHDKKYYIPFTLGVK